MSVEIKGIPEVLNKLESVYGKQAMQAKSDSCLLYTSPSPRDTERSRMPSSA
ncbi:hypothetical protein JMUB7554_27940 [Staphylococcus aureus]